MLKLKLQYSGHLMGRADSFEKTLMLGKTEDRRRNGWQRMRWLDGITDSMDINEQILQVGDGQGGLACCSPWGHKELDTTKRLSWTELSETSKRSNHGSCSVHACHSTNWIVLHVWCWLATKVHITYPHAHSPEKIYCTKTSIVALLSASVDSSTWNIVQWLLSNNCSSISSAISSIHLVMVLAERGTYAIFWTTAFPKSSWKMSIVAVKINFSPIVKGILAFQCN